MHVGEVFTGKIDERDEEMEDMEMLMDRSLIEYVTGNFFSGRIKYQGSGVELRRVCIFSKGSKIVIFLWK